jgi:small subunit ribosomal protein S20
MANSKSAAKRLRQSIKRRSFNRMRKSRVKTSETTLNEKIKAGDKEAVTQFLSKCYSELDKAAKVGTIHINKANRKKQRLAMRVAKMA